VSQLPRAVHCVVVGGGIHRLSSGWHPGLELARRRRGWGRDVVVLDKTGLGASGSHFPWG
jgi:glycine/D-amino acid oxidase-like deaminating enzyme